MPPPPGLMVPPPGFMGPPTGAPQSSQDVWRATPEEMEVCPDLPSTRASAFSDDQQLSVDGWSRYRSSGDIDGTQIMHPSVSPGSPSGYEDGSLVLSSEISACVSVQASCPVLESAVTQLTQDRGGF